MAINDDAEIFNDCGDQGDFTGGTLGDTSGFDPPTNNTATSDTALVREGTTAQQWVMKENQTNEWTYTNQVNNGAGGSRDITGGRIVVFWRWFASDADLDKVTAHSLRLSSDTGFTTNYAQWNILPQIYALDLYGWFPVAVYPTNPDATGGTIVYTSIDSIGWVATTGGTGTKATGFDQALSISFIGGDSASFTFEDLYDQSVTDDLGIAFKFGEFYKFQVNINVGLAGQTANSILNQSDKSVYFDNVEPEHNLGYVIINGTSNESHLILDSVVHTWNQQDGTSPQIFTDPENADQFKIDNCTFINGGELDSPPDTANRWIRVCKFDNIGATTISDGEVSDTTISNSPAVTVSGDADLTGSQILTPTVAADASGLVWNGNFDPDGNLDGSVFSKGTNAHHAIEFGTASPLTMTLRDIDFSGFNATDAQNDSTLMIERTSGTVTINLIGTTGNVSYKSAGATVNLVINPVTISVNVKDSAGANLQNARVLVETAATIASGEIYQAAVTSLTQAAGTATCTTTAAHGLVTGDKVVVRKAQPDEYNKVATVTVSSTTVFTYSVPSGISSPATGTPVVSFVAIHGLTDASGDISASRTWGAAQQMKGWARLKTASSPFYKDADIAFTVNTTSGNPINSVLQPDE